MINVNYKRFSLTFREYHFERCHQIKRRFFQPLFMPPSPLLPSSEVCLEQTLSDSDPITIVVRTCRSTAACPDCSHSSQRVHSRYIRTIADLPWQGVRVCFRLHTRRFFCDQPSCQRQTFSERLPDTVAPYARRTLRLNEALRAIGLALGGEAGSRLAERLSLTTSPATLLRRVRQHVLPTSAMPRVLGVDDWAWRRGHRYGTILVDLETHRVVDLLPVRTAEAFAAWLEAHPGVEIISRDRAGVYAEGARLGAPQARQTADRWHLIRNLSEALTRCFEQHASDLQAAWEEVAQPMPPIASPVSTLLAVRPPNKAEQVRQQRRSRRLRRYEQVMALRQGGATQEEIAQQLQMDTKTIRRYLRAGAFPEMATRRRATGVDRWLPYLEQRWAEGCHNAAQLWREIREQGFRGCQTTIRQWMARLRGPALPGRRRKDSLRRQVPPSPRQTTWLLLHKDSPRSPEQQPYGEALLRRSPDLARITELAHRFLELCLRRSEESLESWLTAAQQTGLRSFALGVERDRAAIEATFRLPWSNGPVEGQIHRLKLIKRQGYGRANFDLLKQRVLPAA
jgi:transposase